MSQTYNTSFIEVVGKHAELHRIRLDEVDVSPHDSVTSDLASGQWRLAAGVDVLISNARCVAVPSVCVS